jgi:APA family basic amino acid/polyamine antiporter
VPLVPALGVLFNGYMMYKLGWLNWARLFIWLAIGLVVYFAYGRKNSRLQNPQALPENTGIAGTAAR